jgi:hypothetical protein
MAEEGEAAENQTDVLKQNGANFRFRLNGFSATCDRTLEGGCEVQSPGMTKRVIPLPQPAWVLPEPVATKNRILVQIGKQSIALDIWSRATLLDSPPAPAPIAVPADRRGGKERTPKS